MVNRCGGPPTLGWDNGGVFVRGVPAVLSWGVITPMAVVGVLFCVFPCSICRRGWLD